MHLAKGVKKGKYHAYNYVHQRKFGLQKIITFSDLFAVKPFAERSKSKVDKTVFSGIL